MYLEKLNSYEIERKRVYLNFTVSEFKNTSLKTPLSDCIKNRAL